MLDIVVRGGRTCVTVTFLWKDILLDETVEQYLSCVLQLVLCKLCHFKQLNPTYHKYYSLYYAELCTPKDNILPNTTINADILS